MSEELRKAFFKFKDRHHRAVQTDTLLGETTNYTDQYYRLEKTARQFWKDADKAEKEFVALLEANGNGGC